MPISPITNKQVLVENATGNQNYLSSVKKRCEAKDEEPLYSFTTELVESAKFKIPLHHQFKCQARK